MINRRKIGALFRKLRGQAGLSLIGLSIFLITVGVISSAVMQLYNVRGDFTRYETTVERQKAVESAIKAFVYQNARLPCAASRVASLDSADFGIEAADCASVTSSVGFGRTDVGTRPVVIGTVPVRSLNLSDEHMFDAWNNRLIYAVTADMAMPNGIAANPSGVISLTDSNDNNVLEVAGTASYVLVSVGDDIRGAYNREGNLLEACPTGTDAGQNCDDSDAVFKNNLFKSTAEDAGKFTHSVTYKGSAAATYSWVTDDWSACVGQCNSGMQTRTVECIASADGSVQPDSFCAGEKPADTQPCSLPACVWDATNWSGCNNTCGTDTKTRTVVCKRGGVNVPDNYCTPYSPKPETEMACERYETCTWQTTPWSACNRPCNGGTQTRTVTCGGGIYGESVAETHCTGPRPPAVQACNTSNCSWQTSGWSGCTRPCDGGTQSRSVWCHSPHTGTVADSWCGGGRPGTSQPCNTHRCCSNNGTNMGSGDIPGDLHREEVRCGSGSGPGSITSNYYQSESRCCSGRVRFENGRRVGRCGPSCSWCGSNGGNNYSGFSKVCR